MLLHTVLSGALRRATLAGVMMIALAGTARADLISIQATTDGTTSGSSAGGTYQAIRDSVSAFSVQTDRLTIGQLNNAGAYNVYRSIATFPLPSMSTASACTLFAYGSSDQSTDDFNVYIVSAQNYGAVDKLDYVLFDGRVVGGAHTGTILNNTWSTTSMLTAAWDSLIFNAAGLDTLVSRSGSSLYIMLMSSEDYGNSAPGGSEWMRFSNSTAANKPRLSLDYTPAIPAGSSRSPGNSYLMQNGDIPPLTKP